MFCRRISRIYTVSSSKLSNILRELVENEENYVRTLKKGIEHYVSSLDVPNLPLRLRGQKRFIFGNVERIYDLHAIKFCPALKACGEDVIKIAETFNNFIRKDYFYCYILFVLNRLRSQKICGENIEFFQVRKKRDADFVGRSVMTLPGTTDLCGNKKLDFFPF
jgi:RhoGEF domain